MCTSANARHTSVTIRIRIRTRIQIRDSDSHQNLIVCSLAHCQPSLKISCKSVRKFLRKLANRQTDKQTNNDDYNVLLGGGNNDGVSVQCLNRAASYGYRTTLPGGCGHLMSTGLDVCDSDTPKSDSDPDQDHTRRSSPTINAGGRRQSPVSVCRPANSTEDDVDRPSHLI